MQKKANFKPDRSRVSSLVRTSSLMLYSSSHSIRPSFFVYALQTPSINIPISRSSRYYFLIPIVRLWPARLILSPCFATSFFCNFTPHNFILLFFPCLLIYSKNLFPNILSIYFNLFIYFIPFFSHIPFIVYLLHAVRHISPVRPPWSPSLTTRRYLNFLSSFSRVPVSSSKPNNTKSRSS